MRREASLPSSFRIPPAPSSFRIPPAPSSFRIPPAPSSFRIPPAPASFRIPPAPADNTMTGVASGLLDGHADQAAPLGPRAVVILDVLIAEQVGEHKPRV